MNPWIEAMRPRTLPVSVAGVLAGTACAIIHGLQNVIPAVCCLLFALLAQIASNFAKVDKRQRPRERGQGEGILYKGTLSRNRGPPASRTKGMCYPNQSIYFNFYVYDVLSVH